LPDAHGAIAASGAVSCAALAAKERRMTIPLPANDEAAAQELEQLAAEIAHHNRL